MSKDNLIESIFDEVLENNRTNTPVHTDENTDLLNKSIDENDVELSSIKDNTPTVDISVTANDVDNAESSVSQAEELLKEEPVVEKEEKSKIAILCDSLRKLLCCCK
jgi:hypothetical protein